jgi:geranylgeranyl pyrophosphate synthase
MDAILEQIEPTLTELLSETRPSSLFKAMRHAVLGGGKRIRPQLCLASAAVVGGRAEDALYPACAIELLHSYTLVHDDLPAMDNDTTRRGKPSVWAAFGEATAILAGDALQALAFQTAARAPRNGEKILATLGEAAVGVVCGQSEELSKVEEWESGKVEKGKSGEVEKWKSGKVEEWKGKETITFPPFHPSTFPPDTDFIYRHKTADLFIAAAVMGAYAGGGTEADVARLREYALNLGLAFQYEDDLLDGDAGFPPEEAKRRITDHTAVALGSLAGLSGDTTFLSALAQRLARRTA